MFTGLIEAKGEITHRRLEKGLLTLGIRPLVSKPWELILGESIAVNGACLTVALIEGATGYFDISSETIEKTALSALKVGSVVNLERAMRLGDRLGGHMVSGHVDGTAELSFKKQEASGSLYKVRVSGALSRYLIDKGSITLDGVSLTINELIDFEDGSSEVSLMLIPTTLKETTFAGLSVGWRFNVEVDLLGKYLERLAQPYGKRLGAPSEG